MLFIYIKIIFPVYLGNKNPSGVTGTVNAVAVCNGHAT